MFIIVLLFSCNNKSKNAFRTPHNAYVIAFAIRSQLVRNTYERITLQNYDLFSIRQWFVPKRKGTCPEFCIMLNC